MDARKTGFDGASFDCITAGPIGWGDYFDFQKNEYIKPDPLMKEITRLLKPGGQFGMSTWLRQEDLNWMYRFLVSQSIKSEKNYHIENEKGWRRILTDWGYTDIQVLVESATYAYNSIDFWWKKRTDYDWVPDDNGKVAVESLKDLAYGRIKPKRKGKISFSRKALFVIGRKPEKTSHHQSV